MDYALSSAIAIPGCVARRPSANALAEENAADIKEIEVLNFKMEGWSTFDGQKNGDFPNAFDAQYLLGEGPYEGFLYTQDTHGHRFSVTPFHLNQLRMGKAVGLPRKGKSVDPKDPYQIITTEAQGHIHWVVINPTRPVKRTDKQGNALPSVKVKIYASTGELVKK
jgi:hypothetical protein